MAVLDVLNTMPSGLHSITMAALGAMAFGCAVYFAARFAGVVSLPLMYHVLIYGAFFGVYMVMPGGFDKHFNVPEKKKMNVADVAYYTIVVHSTAGFGDIYPLTFWGRAVVTAHLGLVFLATAGLLPLGGAH